MPRCVCCYDDLGIWRMNLEGEARLFGKISPLVLNIYFAIMHFSIGLLP